MMGSTRNRATRILAWIGAGEKKKFQMMAKMYRETKRKYFDFVWIFILKDAKRQNTMLK
ncbi:hypothetical protein [Fibrobacter sp. UBA4297]|uniref:hypothetical protein n=1 Tax=Fibrobacter sp. UBA4297 TaxID=1946536 RepID=UPI0025BF5675|nr:hypothetical protein [Fibrobacter sp. UBA4297]